MVEVATAPGLVTITLVVLTAIGAGIVCGFFLTFSTGAIQGINALEPRDAVRAMQSINIYVVRPPLMIALFGTGLLSIAVIIAGFLALPLPFGWLVIIGGVVYLVGNLILTMAYHVPRNNRLAAVDPDGPEAAAEWRTYHREWTAGNHVRTVTAGLAAALLIIALVLL